MMLADGGADFAKAIGAEMDTKDFGGIRLRRLAMLVNVSISCIQSSSYCIAFDNMLQCMIVFWSV
jgi:peroxiredoxin